jgi:hypothetical protein
MKKNLLVVIPLSIAGLLVFLSNSNDKFEKFHKDGIEKSEYSSNPILALTGAPGNANCTQCHSGSIQSAIGNVDLTYSDVNNEYLPGQTYTFNIGIPLNAENGFQMTILDNSNNQAGTFTAGVNSNVASLGGKQYIRQSNKTSSWTYDWTAPDFDIGDLTVYYSFVKSNSNFSPNGDVVYLGQEVVSSVDVSGISEYEKTDKKINIFYNEQSNELNLKYSLKEKANLQLQVSDLSGKLIETVDLGQKSFGPHNSKIHFDSNPTEGVYIVSLFINNNVYNRKIYLKF